MGFFSRTRYSVSAAVMPLVEPNPDFLKDSVGLSVLKGTPISYGVVNAALDSMAFSVDRFRMYAKNHYTLGLPTGVSSETTVFNDTDVVAAIKDSTGITEEIALDYQFNTELTVVHAILDFLSTERNLIAENNEIKTYPPGLPQPERITEGVHAGDPVSIDQVTVYDIELDDNMVTVHITYHIRSIVNHRNPFYTDPVMVTYYTEDYELNPAYHLGKDYCIAKYFKVTPDGLSEKMYWWFYDIDSRVYSELTPSLTEDNTDYFLPVVPIRRDNLSMTREELHDTPLYKTSKDLMKKININIDYVSDKLEENPDIADIDHAYIMFGVDMQTEDPVCLRYLVSYFDFISNSQLISQEDRIGQRINLPVYQTNRNVISYGVSKETTENRVVSSRTETVTDSSVVVNRSFLDADETYGLDMAIYFSYVTSCLHHGTIGDGTVGNVTKSIEREAYYVERGENENGSVVYKLEYSHFLRLKQQVSASVYREIIVKGLEHKNEIYRERSVVTGLDKVLNDPDEHNFIIPLNYQIAETLSWQDQNMLYQNTLNLVITSWEKYKVKWYQTGFFKAVIAVIGIIITIWTGQAWVMGLMEAANMLIYLALSFLIGMLVDVVFKLVAEVIGPEFAILLAVVAFALSKNPKFAATMVGSFKVTIAQSFLMLSGALIQGANKAIEGAIQEITEQYEVFRVESAEKLERLQAAKDLLKPAELLPGDLLEIQQTRFEIIENESPTAFYDRTIHIGNIGTLILDVVPNYHNISLELPKPVLY